MQGTTVPSVARKPIGFFRIPPNYTELSEEERHEVAEAIGEKMRAALLRNDDPSDTAEPTSEAPL
jgi:hypothetical protein